MWPRGSLVPDRARETPSGPLLLLSNEQPRPVEPALPTPLPLRLGEPIASFSAGMRASASPPATPLPSSYQAAPPASPPLSLLRSGDLPDAMEHLCLAPARRVPALHTEQRATARIQRQLLPQVRPPSFPFTPEVLRAAQAEAPPSSELSRAEPGPQVTHPTLQLADEQLYHLALMLEVEPLDGDSTSWFPSAAFLGNLVNNVHQDAPVEEAAALGLPLLRSLSPATISPEAIALPPNETPAPRRTYRGMHTRMKERAVALCIRFRCVASQVAQVMDMSVSALRQGVRARRLRQRGLEPADDDEAREMQGAVSEIAANIRRGRPRIEVLVFPQPRQSAVHLNRFLWLLRGAQSSIDVCVHMFTHDVLAKIRKVQVRIWTHRKHMMCNGSQISKLVRAQIEVRIHPKVSFSHHYKWCLIDNYITMSGSLNWTYNAFSNGEIVEIKTGYAAVNARYQAIIDRMNGFYEHVDYGQLSDHSHVTCRSCLEEMSEEDLEESFELFFL